MNLPKELTTVTPLSKYLAMVIFITLPFVGFFLGMRYQETMNLSKSQQMEVNLSIPRHPTPTSIAIPTIDPSVTENWKTYTSMRYGLSFRYPKNYYITEGYTKEYDTHTIIVSNTKTDDFYSSPKNISISLNISPKDFKGDKIYYNSCCAYGWIQKNFNNFVEAQNGSLQNSLIKIDNANIDNVTVVRFKITKDHTNQTLSTPTLYAAFMTKDAAFLLSGITNDRDLIFEKTYYDIFNQILATFKFTQ